MARFLHCRADDVSPSSTCVVPLAAVLCLSLITVSCDPSPRIDDRVSGRTPLARIVRAWELRKISLQPAVQEAIKECMRARRFRYVPHSSRLEFASAPAHELSAADFTAKYGYGITTRDDDKKAFEAPVAPDPNKRMVRSLSPSRRRAYVRALWGSRPDSVKMFHEGEEVAQWYPSSCVTKANEAIIGPQKAAVEASLRMNDLLAKLQRAISHDPRILQATEAWSRCMQRRGRHYRHPNDIPTDLARRRHLLVGTQGTSAPKTKDNRGSERGMERLRGFEFAIAQDDMTCRDQTRLDHVVFKVRTAYEIDFVRQNHHLISHVWPVPPALLSEAMSGDH